ncbi:MAG: methyltransferase domain-containing protein [Bacteroidota bacterium]
MKACLYIIFLFSVLIFFFSSCASKRNATPPYVCGPVLSEKQIDKVFIPLVEILELSAGDVFADVGASSGAHDIMISTLVDSVTFYIQDIDTTCLNQKQLDKIIAYYSDLRGQSLKSRNQYFITIGELKQTKLPDDTFDKIYSNATFHVLSHKEALMTDVYTKLKVGGSFFIRDGFAKAGKIEYCEDKTCGHQLTSEEEMIKIVQASGFSFVKKWDDFKGYPVFKFEK